MKSILFTILTVGLSILAVVSLNAENKSVPETVQLDSITEQYEPVRLDHAKHAMIAGDCSLCHHQHPTIENRSCKDCHSLDSRLYKDSVEHTFLTCQSCHGSVDPDNPGMPGLKVAYHRVCFECHKGMGNVGIDPKGCVETCHVKKLEEITMKRLHTVP